MYRKVTVIGNIGRNAELRYFDDGSTVCTFNIASQNYGDSEPKWDSCKLYGKRGESLKDFLVTGQCVYIEGKEKSRVGKSRDGEEKTYTDLRVDEIKLIGKKAQDEDEQSKTPTHDETMNKLKKQNAEQLQEPQYEDDVPF